MNVLSDLRIKTPPPSRLRRAADILLGKSVTLVLAAVALVLAIGTFVLLSGGAARRGRGCMSGWCCCSAW